MISTVPTASVVASKIPPRHASLRGVLRFISRASSSVRLARQRQRSECHARQSCHHREGLGILCQAGSPRRTSKAPNSPVHLKVSEDIRIPVTLSPPGNATIPSKVIALYRHFSFWKHDFPLYQLDLQHVPHHHTLTDRTSPLATPSRKGRRQMNILHAQYPLAIVRLIARFVRHDTC